MKLSGSPGAFAHSRPVTECGQCGERIYIPEWTEYREGGRIRHLWECEACGYAFETTIRFAANGTVETADVHLTESTDRERTISVHPLTGRVEVEDGYLVQKVLE